MLGSPLLWLIVWSCAHVLIRLTTTQGLELDEAEQMIWSQDLALGYGAQPPLYTWLQWLMSKAMGPSVLALSTLKIGLIALTFAFLWLSARELTSQNASWWLAGGLVLFPQMGWESLRDLTHTVLLTCMIAATWFALVRQIKRPHPTGFIWLGLAIGFGLLSKYSYALFIGAAFLAALSLPEGRRSMLSKGWWLAPMIIVMVIGPHFFWLSQHWMEASASTVNKLGVSTQPHYLAGIKSLLIAVLSNLALWLIVMLAVFRSSLWKTSASEIEASRAAWAKPWLARYLLILAAAFVAMVFFAQASQFKDRWLYPLLCMIPMMAFVIRPELTSHVRHRHYALVVLGCFSLMTVATALRPWATGQLGKRDEINEPIGQLVKQLRESGYDGTAPIIASDSVVGGALRLHFTKARIIVCNINNTSCIKTTSRQYLQIARSARPNNEWWQSNAHLEPGPITEVELPYANAKSVGPTARYYFRWQGVLPQAIEKQGA